MATDDQDTLIEQLAVGVLPKVTPYQFAIYVYLLHAASTENAELRAIKLGKRTLAAALGKGTRSSSGNIQHIATKLRELHDLGLIRLGSSDRMGTAIEVRKPTEVDWVRDALGVVELVPRLDYFRDPILRRELFDRDRWRCRYCGNLVDEGTATLDHIVPQCADGGDELSNLATACHGCNSVKSGRSEADAAPLLLARLRDIALRQGSTFSPVSDPHTARP